MTAEPLDAAVIALFGIFGLFILVDATVHHVRHWLVRRYKRKALRDVLNASIAGRQYPHTHPSVARGHARLAARMAEHATAGASVSADAGRRLNEVTQNVGAVGISVSGEPETGSDYGLGVVLVMRRSK